MVSFNILAAAFAAFAAVSEASYHGHMAKRHLHMRASYGNLTDVLYPTAIGTGSIGTGSPAPLPDTTAPPVVPANTPEHDFTTTITQTTTKCLTLTYTLGSGKEVVTTITKQETTTRTIAHVKATVTIAPVIESTPSVSVTPVATSSTIAPVVSSVVSSSSSSSGSTPTIAPVVSSVVPSSSSESTRTSITTLYVTVPASGTLTVAAPSSAPACPSVETVYVPTYVTVYNTVTVAPPVPSVHTSVKPPYQNTTTSRTTTSTSTTTVRIFKTVTLSTLPATATL
ncbi:hypothetical protein L873DRAFT_1786448 [Choiromyces venosus 120613-1]|uniref:Uncharacterized protein n=1 Tax=Choiromyces venosus 120613-1 TaxID=1336337 RepID=A0A3N4K0Q9_9PEZI|nr:hypothetical protein L873DRAFT_1786448 [Choiromyces venosus 120613-1]